MSRLIVFARRRKKSRALRPTTTSVTSAELDWRTSAPARRMTLVLKAPARPRSAVMMTICRRGPSRCSISGWPVSAPLTRLPSSSAILLAYGRGAQRQGARDLLPRLAGSDRSLNIPKRGHGALRGLDALGGGELGLALADRLRQLVTEGVADLLLVANLGEHLRMAPLKVAVEELLEGPDGIDRHVVEQSLAAGEDDRHLLLDGPRLVLGLLVQL